MAFEMSLPHAPRIQALAADGGESLAADERQWELYFAAQAAIRQQQEAEATGQEPAGEEGGKAAAAAAPQPSDPQWVLEKLLTARGELDVIVDLVTFVEQQQFLAVEGLHRHPPPLEERLRTRALRLASARAALRGAGGLLGRGLEALQAQARVDDRFLSDLAQLRRRWKLRRHGGAAGLFYADLSLPLRGGAARAASQEGAQASLIMDTNGDACMVEAAAPGGRRRAVRGAAAIHAVLERKQQLLAWRVLGQLFAAGARVPRHEADADGAVAAVQRMATDAQAACQVALHSAVAASGSSSGPGAMDLDAPAAGGGGGLQHPAADEAAVTPAEAPAVPSSLASSAALDIRAALALPGFQQRFEAHALLLLARLLPGGGTSSGRSSSSGGSIAAVGPGSTAEEVLDEALRWLRHAALRHRVAATLARWCASGAGRAAAPVDTHEEYASAWQLAPSGAVVVVQADRLHVEGTPGAAAAAAARGLSRPDFERVLAAL